MDTKNIPALVMLIAGAIASVIMLLQGTTNQRFLITVLAVLVCFYFIGSVIKMILDYNIGDMKKTDEDEEGVENPDEDTEIEDISTEDQGTAPQEGESESADTEDREEFVSEPQEQS